MKIILLLSMLAVLAGCASTPTSIGPMPTSGLPTVSPTSLLGQDLVDAAWQADQAIAVKALNADDPLPPCLHMVNSALGLEGSPAAPASFTPRNTGLVSQAVTLYILDQQAQAFLGTPVTVPTQCEAVVGRIVINRAKAINRALPAVITGAIIK